MDKYGSSYSNHDLTLNLIIRCIVFDERMYISKKKSGWKDWSLNKGI